MKSTLCLGASLSRRADARIARLPDFAIGSLMNRQIAPEPTIREVITKVHKQKVMDKMGTESLADLVRIAEHLRILSPKNRYQASGRDRLPL